MLYSLMMLLFVDASLHHSMDRLKRRYAPAAIPCVVLSGLFLVAFYLERYSVSKDTGVLRANGILAEIIAMEGMLEKGLTRISFVLGTVFMLYALRMARSFREGNGRPILCRLEIIFIPWLIGWIPELLMVVTSFLDMRYHLRLPSVPILCAAFSLILSGVCGKNRSRYSE